MMQRIFADTNVIIDFLGERKPFYESAANIITLAQKRNIELLLTPISLATASYIITKNYTEKQVWAKLQLLNSYTTVCKVDNIIVQQALASSFTDFEDALQYFSALAAGAEVILTRNQKDFTASTLPISSAEEFLLHYKRSN
jgi:predicted nucleic acid-binding protein